MRRSTPRPIRLAIALAAGGAMALTACGSDDGGDSGSDDGGGLEAYCQELVTFADSTLDSEGETLAADFQALADAAPSEIADEMNQVVEAFEQLESLPDEPETEEEMNEMLELAGSIDEPLAVVEEFSLENCPDLPPSVFGE